jgi:hypothetical protein
MGAALSKAKPHEPMEAEFGDSALISARHLNPERLPWKIVHCHRIPALRR